MDEAPKLAPPGAGLPAWELALIRWKFSRGLRSATREGVLDAFARERERLDLAWQRCPVEKRSQRVLIPRLRGMEDSSRHWSVWMTLEHLGICQEAFSGVVERLGRGETPGGKASTASVKPSSGAGQESEARFQGSCEAFGTVLAQLPDWRTAATYEHPWFGPLDAAGWSLIIPVHLRIHRGQIERITEALRR
ncbi:hypothetical protein HNR46_003142 [Haloferula luteola]|uniref:DinB-like domain-containing protein n=1 Tax=Haloferula luteola TaxID=595692 RepID=A0A840V5I6_9BACT|nr:DinB family protein [Haloferula luteola]MBB5352893.1 hypothetical protein [Haloferula luteola]